MPSNRTAMIEDFTEGPILKKLFFFSVPFMLSNALQVLYSLVDMMVVGKVVGGHGLSAVATASQVFVFMTMLCLGFSTGGQIYISQLIGGGKRDRLNNTIGTLFTVILALGILMTVLGLLFAKPFLRLLNTPPEAFDGAMDYMLVCSAGIILSYGYNMVSAVLRGMGDSKHPFLFIAIASVLNIVLDIIFIAGFGWGVFGAALATIIGQGVAFAYSAVFLYRRRADFNFDFRLRSFKPDAGILFSLLNLGIPFAIRFCAINISMLFVTSLVNGLGYQASAAFGVGVKLDDTANKIAQGVMLAGAAMIGQNFGARKFDRIRRIVHCCWGLTSAMYAAYTFSLLAWPEKLFGMFNDEAGVINLSFIFASAIVWHFPALLIMKGTNALIHGIGNAWFGLVLAILDGLVFRIALSWMFGIWFGRGLFGFILGYGLATYVTALPGLFYFLFWPWMKRRPVTE